MKSRKLTITLLVFYLAVLSWIILLKFRASFAFLDTRRNINLIPFGDMQILNGLPNYNEVIANGLVFVPLGIFICMLGQKKSFGKLIAPIILLSLFFEVIQYIFAIGASDITDLLANTFGGIVGMGIFFIFHKICNEHVYKVINTTSLTLAIGLTLFIVSIHPLRRERCVTTPVTFEVEKHQCSNAGRIINAPRIPSKAILHP